MNRIKAHHGGTRTYKNFNDLDLSDQDTTLISNIVSFTHFH